MLVTNKKGKNGWQIVKELNKFIDRYIVVWNEPNAELRRKSIAELWSTNATHFTPKLKAHGLEAIYKRVTDSYGKSVGKGDYLFQSANNANGHHNVVKSDWQMVSTKDGKTAAVGSVFIFLDDDGRILADYQF